jgi:hypothetical protein
MVLSVAKKADLWRKKDDLETGAQLAFAQPFARSPQMAVGEM